MDQFRFGLWDVQKISMIPLRLVEAYIPEPTKVLSRDERIRWRLQICGPIQDWKAAEPSQQATELSQRLGDEHAVCFC